MADPIARSLNDLWNDALLHNPLGEMNSAVWDICNSTSEYQISNFMGDSGNNSSDILANLPVLETWNESLVGDLTESSAISTGIDNAAASVWNLDSSEILNGAVVITNGNVYPTDIQIVKDNHQLHQRNIKEESFPSSSIHVPSALPPSTDWPGNYNFDVSFGPQEKNTKGVSWTFSKSKNKLYVGKDVPCPINFSADKDMTDVFIRATVLYSSPEHTSEVVQRCATHIKEDTDQGLYDAEHFVRCESNMAHYEIDQLTNQRSVVVPFENPPAGQLFSTYLFKFSCFGSCAGGPNRRSLMIIFKLEQGCEEIGRRKLELKVCACPGRDRKTEEKQIKDQSVHVRPSKRGIDPESITTAPAFEPKRRKNPIPNDKGYFTITTRDVECYHFLKEMKKMHTLNAAFKKLPPETRRYLLNQESQLRSSDAEE